MDIQHLVDRLEDLIDEGKHIPFSKYTMMDEERALEIIDQMRISIPEEVEKAARILAQRERVLAQANEDAARILQQARSKGEQMLEEDISVQAAQNHAANIIEEARQKAAQVLREADNYVLQVLSSLEQQLQRNLNTIRNGINEVNRGSTEMPPVESAVPVTPFPQTDARPSVEAESRSASGISLRHNQSEE